MLTRSSLLIVSLTAMATFIACRRPTPPVAGAEAGGRVDTSFVLFESSSLYTAWPAAARTEDGDILVLYVETDEHLGPDGRIVGIRSSDEGQTWSKPFLVYDTPLDEREAGITALRDGRLVAHLWSTRHTRQSYEAMAPGSYFEATVSKWVDHVSGSEYAQAAPLEGGHAVMSTDGGRTWGDPVEGPDTVHGGVQLENGSILVASYRKTGDFVTVHRADSWQGPYRQIAEVGASTRADDDSTTHLPTSRSSRPSSRPDSLRFGEPSILQLASGRIIMMMRATPIPYSNVDPRSLLWESYSDDEGESWVQPYPTPLWGFPPHLMRCRDGRVIVTYGYRRPPYGQRAAVSVDGVTWRQEDEIVLRDDAPNEDLGYPASVELRDGRILTVYYQSDPSDTLRTPEGPLPDRHKPDIWGTIWTMPRRSPS